MCYAAVSETCAGLHQNRRNKNTKVWLTSSVRTKHTQTPDKHKTVRMPSQSGFRCWTLLYRNLPKVRKYTRTNMGATLLQYRRIEDDSAPKDMAHAIALDQSFVATTTIARARRKSQLSRASEAKFQQHETLVVLKYLCWKPSNFFQFCSRNFDSIATSRTFSMLGLLKNTPIVAEAWRCSTHEPSTYVSPSWPVSRRQQDKR